MKGTHYSKKSSRKLSDRFYQSRLIVFEWTPAMERWYQIGLRLTEGLVGFSRAIQQFAIDTMTRTEGGFLELPPRKKE